MKNLISTNADNMEDYQPENKNQDNEDRSLFDSYNKVARRGRLKESVENGIISEKDYVEELQKLPLEERKMSDFIKEKTQEELELKKRLLNSEEISSALEFVEELFKSKISKVDGSPSSNHFSGVAGILAKYNLSEQEIIVGILHDVIEDIENGKELLISKGYSQEIIFLIEELSENKSLAWKQRKQEYINHLADASNKLKGISAADKIYNVRSFIDQYIIEGDAMRNKFNAGKEEQVWLLKEYIKALKHNFNDPISDELDELIQRFLNILK